MAVRVTFYTRRGCCLCDEAKRVVESARASAGFELEVIDIDGDENLRKLYNDEVPVIAIDGRKAFKYRISREELLKKLAARS